MSRPIAQPAECFGGSERMQQLGSLATVFFIAFVARNARHAVEERFERIIRRGVARHFGFSVGCTPGPCLLIVLFDDVWKHKSIPVTRHGTDESRFARIFAERPAEGPDRLAQCAIGYNDIAPDAIEDLPPMHRLMTPLDKKDKEVEIAGNERQLTSIADEQTSAGRQDEIVEPITGHSRGPRSLCPRCRLCTPEDRTRVRAHSIAAIV